MAASAANLQRAFAYKLKVPVGLGRKPAPGDLDKGPSADLHALRRLPTRLSGKMYYVNLVISI
jgi:hypothetical protein